MTESLTAIFRWPVLLHALGIQTLFSAMPAHTTITGQTLNWWRPTPSTASWGRRVSASTSTFLDTYDTYRRIDEAAVSQAGWFKLKSLGVFSWIGLSGPASILDSMHEWWAFVVREFAKQLQQNPIAAAPYIFMANLQQISFQTLLRREVAFLAPFTFGPGRELFSRITNPVVDRLSKPIKNALKKMMIAALNPAVNRRRLTR